jgi:hypothetical protein
MLMHIYGSIALCLELADFLVSESYTQSIMTPWTGDQPVARPLLTHKITQTQNKRTQISMP